MVVVGGVVDVVGGVLGRTSEVVKKKNHTVRVAVDPTHSFVFDFIGLCVCLVGCCWWCYSLLLLLLVCLFVVVASPFLFLALI